MLKKILLLSFVFYFFLASVGYAGASEKQFDVSISSNYEIEESGLAKVTQVVTITNKTEYYFTPSYTSRVGFSDISQIEAFNKDGPIPATFDISNKENKGIKLTFPKRYAGLNQTNEFTLKFVTKNVATKKGNIWEVSIPGIEDLSSLTSYKVEIQVPKSFGQASIIKPSKKSNELVFSKSDDIKGGIFLYFGDEQFYKFDLNYNISNPNLFPVKTEIAIPPSTNYQEVLLNNFSEKPNNVTLDKDGNWIAEYRLLPQQKKTIRVKGVVKVLASPTKSSLLSNQAYTKAEKFWDSNSKNIKDASSSLKTPRQIYDFVVAKLSYNRNKIATDNLRLGGSKALDNPKDSVCLEFTDLFISLARSNGIPAREVEGFAYTSNTKSKPLSLVNDILHAWPEYYDFDKKSWVMVDPTWGNTTNGVDFFDSLDFDHVAFVIKGYDSKYPIPAGGYKFSKDSKDVKVEFAKESDYQKNENIVVSSTFPKRSFPKFTIQGTIDVENKSNFAVLNKKLKVTSSFGNTKEFAIDYLPPFGHKSITTSFSDIPFLTNGKYIITIQLDKKIYKKEVLISVIPDGKLLLILGGIFGVSIITAAVTFHTGSLLIRRQKRKNSVHR